MDSPEDWRWVWIIATAVFAIGELTSPGSFFMLPFAIGALVATVLAFLDVDIVIEWLAFVGVSLAVFAALRPVARRLNRSDRRAVDRRIGDPHRHRRPGRRRAGDQGDRCRRRPASVTHWGARAMTFTTKEVSS